jgi:ketosteroid isomerase-like protein
MPAHTSIVGRLLIGALVVVGGATTVHAQSEECTAQALSRADSNWQAALATRSIDRVLSSYDSDAAMCGAAMPQIRGVERIRRFWERQFADSTYRLMWKVEKTVVLGDCEHGYTSGRWSVHTVQGDTLGSYLALWHKDPGSTWRVLIDCAWF